MAASKLQGTTLLEWTFAFSCPGRMCFQEAEESRSAIEMFLKGSIKSVVCRQPVTKGH